MLSYVRYQKNYLQHICSQEATGGYSPPKQGNAIYQNRRCGIQNAEDQTQVRLRNTQGQRKIMEVTLSNDSVFEETSTEKDFVGAHRKNY